MLRYEAEGWGVGELWLEGETVVWHESPRPGAPVTGAPQTGLTARLQRYFAGGRDSFDDVPVDLDWCTDFQLAVAQALRRVPYGETVTYGELAALAGYPNAQRAAGSFCAQNRLFLFVPCHRVVAANGLGSYGELGVAYKRRLLELEGAAL